MKNVYLLKLLLYSTVLNVLVLTATAQMEKIESPVTSMSDFCKELPRSAYQSLSRIESPDDWFELYKVAPGVTAIYEPHQWQETISYLIEGKQRALLFDTGNGIGDIQQIVKQLTNKPTWVLNSHSHYDHVGGNFAFPHIYGMDTAFTRLRQSGMSNADIRIEVSAQALCRQPPEGVNEDNHLGRAYKITRFIDDGHQFDLGGREVEVMHIPGHTPDAIALIDRAAGLLWTGDSYYSGPIWLFAPETDLAAYAKSIERLAAEVPNLKALLPAHNTPWVKPEVLLRVQSGFSKFLAGELAPIDQGDGTVIYELEGESEFSFLLLADALQEQSNRSASD